MGKKPIRAKSKELSQNQRIVSRGETMSEIRKILKEDWTVIPFLGLTLLGFAVAIFDFVYLQNLSFKIFGFAGLLLLVVGGLIRMKARLELKKKAGFTSLVGTSKLQIVKKHTLVEDGLYRNIRHPLYLGEISRNLGFVLIFSSVYGTLIVLLASSFLFFRIQLEEKMLVTEFGDEYEECKRKTKRIIPFIY